ncbi:hypothetical protein BDV59DRAFT_193855 [Aspergillus ambiguus]|uniref:uncharacterized protein n=1 Tax=Aspergillus ambiguus TaxID=176160 RepID=UPI003CCD60BB
MAEYRQNIPNDILPPLTMVQFISPPQGGYELILLWRFRQAPPGEAGITTWTRFLSLSEPFDTDPSTSVAPNSSATLGLSQPDMANSSQKQYPAFRSIHVAQPELPFFGTSLIPEDSYRLDNVPADIGIIDSVTNHPQDNMMNVTHNPLAYGLQAEDVSIPSGMAVLNDSGVSHGKPYIPPRQNSVNLEQGPKNKNHQELVAKYQLGPEIGMPTISPRNETLTDSGYASTTRGNVNQKDEVESIYSAVSHITDMIQGYINELADELAQTVQPYKLSDEVLEQIFGALPEFLRAFALSLGQSSSDQTYRDVMVFVHRYRRNITSIFKERLSEKDIHDQKCRDMNQMSLDDIMALWHDRVRSLEPESPLNVEAVEPTEHTTEKLLTSEEGDVGELPNENRLPESPEVEGEADELPEIDVYRNIIQKSFAYTSLVNNIRRECIFASFEPDVRGQVRRSILQCLPISPHISRQKPAELLRVSFKISWDPLKFLMDEEYTGRLEEKIAKVITLTGSATSAQAMTCGQYIQQVWPSTGSSILWLLKKLVSRETCVSCNLSDGTTLTMSSRLAVDQASSTNVCVDLKSTAPVIAEIGEQMAWLASALRSSPFTQGEVAYSRPLVNSVTIGRDMNENNSRITYIIEIGVEIYQGSRATEMVNGECWHNLFGMPVVVEGFPIRRRLEQHPEGIEIPLNMMAALADTRKVNLFDGKIIIKGFSTMLVPAKCSPTAVTWHLLYRKDGGHISYLESEQFPLLNIGIRQLEEMRHFVGWCPASRLYAGEADANYNIKNSRLPRPSGNGILSNASLSGAYEITGNSAFEIGRKDIRLRRSSYIKKIRWISEKYAILWEVAEKRGWLVNGATALLHLVRASLKQDQLDEKFSALCQLTDDKFQEERQSHQSDSALDVLLNQKNLELKIYAEDEEPFKHLVESLYDYLEKTIEYQIKSTGPGPQTYSQARSALDGWDFTDLALERDPIYPRRAILDEGGRSWVDFTPSIHTVTLCGRGFGEIIRPARSLCSLWETLPQGKCYLAAEATDLYNIMELFGDSCSRPMRLSHETVWYMAKETMTQCSCEAQGDATHADIAQVLLPSSMLHMLPRSASFHDLTGAVLFGHNTGDQWFWGDSGRPTRTPQALPQGGREPTSKGSESMSTTGSDHLTEENQDHSYPAGEENNPAADNWRSESTTCTHSVEDYKLGIICALKVELMAVRMLFDETHGRLLVSNEDPNSYALGRIGSHDIVAVCLPHGTYGTNPAADVASNMRRSFPALKFCLLVGIGAGVPSDKNDIRLGDVVVSTPSGRYSGVLPYDIIKSLDAGGSQLNGYLCSPPAHLMGAISELESDPDISPTPLQGYLQQIAECKPEYKHPGSDHDRLFESSYTHRSRHDSCDLCSSNHEIRRHPRPSTHPHIHYGLIASGNQVMRSADIRDKLGQEHNVLCFEMEGAGIMNSLRCLVIRGICDYADSHKNKRWQNYAAAAAAAYAKLLLSRSCRTMCEADREDMGMTVQ